jgi:hypothetical protein
LLDLQREIGNRAVTALVPRPSVQRDVGWPEAAGRNRGGPRPIDAQHKLLRVAIAGLTAGNTAASPNPAKTAEQAADDTGARAVVWIHPDLDPAKPVQVVVHLHGLTSRSADPFPGWRETSADPKSDEAMAAKKRALKTATAAARREKKPRPKLADMANPLANKVRDIERDRIGQQVEALADPQVMAVLPQGTGLGGTAMFGAGFDPDALVGEVLQRLAKEAEVTAAVKKYTKAPANFTILLSAHSGGGATVADVLDDKRTGHLGGLMLFDALWTQESKTKPGTWVSGQRDAVISWVRNRCQALGAVLRSTKTAAEKDAAVEALPGVHGYFTGGVYSRSYKGLEAEMHAIVDRTIPSAYAERVKAKFRVRHAATEHDRILSEVGASTKDVAPLEESLRQRGTFVSH